MYLGSTFPEESVKRTHKQDTDVFVNGTTEPAVDEASVIQYSSFRYMSKTVTKVAENS